MLRIKSFLRVLLLLLALLFSQPVQLGWHSAGQSISLREPFSLELPELGGTPITAPEAVIPAVDLHTLRLRIRKPFADAINYGKIYTKINGESSGVIQNTSADANGYLVLLDLDSRPRFKLQRGKNVIEIQAIDRGNRSYYASYVLLPGVGAGVANAPKLADATIENVALTTGVDRQPPVVYLTEPNGAVRLLVPSRSLTVQGFVTDDSGAVASVTINGQAAALKPPTNLRKLTQMTSEKPVPGNEPPPPGALSFERTLTLNSNVPSIIVEAKDRAGNLTRLTVPVRQREPINATQFKGRKFAMIAGVSRYKYHDGGLTDLAYADADARALRDFLQRREGGGFAPSDIYYLENEQATVEAMRAGLRRFLAQAGANDLVLLFLAGHGGPDPYAPQNLYYVLHDSKVADLPNTALPMTELQETLEHGIRAQRVLVFIDTCHSAGLSGEKLTLARGIENNLLNLYAAKLFNEAGRAVLTSSDVNEISRESQRWGGGHGVFTWALLEGLRGEADTSGDHLITAGELFNYVRDRVRIETTFRQNPRALPGLNADLTLAFVASTSEGKQVPPPSFDLTRSFALRIPELQPVKRLPTQQNRK